MAQWGEEIIKTVHNQQFHFEFLLSSIHHYNLPFGQNLQEEHKSIAYSLITEKDLHWTDWIDMQHGQQVIIMVYNG